MFTLITIYPAENSYLGSKFALKCLQMYTVLLEALVRWDSKSSYVSLLLACSNLI